jgi:hypothetical protein
MAVRLKRNATYGRLRRQGTVKRSELLKALDWDQGEYDVLRGMRPGSSRR